MSLFLPDYHFRALTDVTPEFLLPRGIDLLLLDIDNTMSPYGAEDPSEKILDWAKEMQRGGVTLMIVSNNRHGRSERFSELMGISNVGNALKPAKRGVLQALKMQGRAPDRAALAGDQIYTDILAANRCGVTSVLVEPISLDRWYRVLRFWLEEPFRLCRKIEK